MRKLAFSAAVLFCCFVCFACGKKHVGTNVDTSLPRWCKWEGIDKDCQIAIGHMFFECRIQRSQSDGVYRIRGTVDPTSGRKARLAKNWQGMFSMFVAKDNVIIDNVGFLPKMAADDSDQKLSFSIDYTQPEGFDALTFGYDITVGPVR